MLFALATIVIWVAFHTPTLSIVEGMSDEELEATELQTSQALLFACGASAMLMFLYIFLEYIAGIFEVIITFTSSMAGSIII